MALYKNDQPDGSGLKRLTDGREHEGQSRLGTGTLTRAQSDDSMQP